MKKTFIIVGVVVVLLVGGAWWSRSLQSRDPNVIATKGLHWHPKLTITAKGVPIEIPKGIGLTGAHQPIHTHDDLPILHLEFGGRVTKSDTELGQFFKVWGKDFMEFGTSVRMMVNGVPNTDLDKYEMKDGDKIELIYE